MSIYDDYEGNKPAAPGMAVPRHTVEPGWTEITAPNKVSNPGSMYMRFHKTDNTGGGMAGPGGSTDMRTLVGWARQAGQERRAMEASNINSQNALRGEQAAALAQGRFFEGLKERAQAPYWEQMVRHNLDLMKSQADYMRRRAGSAVNTGLAIPGSEVRTTPGAAALERTNAMLEEERAAANEFNPLSRILGNLPAVGLAFQIGETLYPFVKRTLGFGE